MLISRNMYGTLHEIIKEINRRGWAWCFLQAIRIDEGAAIVIFCVPLERSEVIAELGS